ncbi:single-stranded DNA-binding protein [Mucilaginibacter robiniae]|uniref:Single-stranded DNA-binding protein n=1 Tax=Mucilaginibacter robiniae TaxID=2728022 RepID=A0A7L5DZZ6_9SPHI|nr:single-stranded DNA-binding protein [Mucilaginibacter robiniae]QJD96690.1 single-stranded DNA-binding protein [Mucilaginibacter robiniae]
MLLNNTGINKVFLVGQIEKEPRLHKNQDKEDELYFTLATTEQIKKGNDYIEHIELHSVKVPVTHSCMSNVTLTKGQLLHVAGKIQTKMWVDDLKVKRYKTEILVLQLEVLTTTPVPTY